MKKKIFISFSVVDEKRWGTPLNFEKNFDSDVLIPVGSKYQVTFKSDNLQQVLQEGSVVAYCYDDDSNTLFVVIKMNFVIGVVGDADLLKAKFTELAKASGFEVSSLNFDFKEE